MHERFNNNVFNHYTAVGRDKIQNTKQRANTDEDIEQQEFSFLLGGIQYGTATLEDGWWFLT